VAAGREPLALDDPRDHHEQGDHDEEQQRDADEQQHGLDPVDRVGVAPALGHVGPGRACGDDDERAREEHGRGTTDATGELGGHGGKTIGSGCPRLCPVR
jgi:hypothetical protein